jgi:galactokinase/mevalonate kinase-like predicted kinase
MTQTPNMTDHTKGQMPDRQQLKSDAADAIEKAKAAGEQKLESGKQTVAEQAEKVAGVFDEAAKQLSQNDLESLAEYTNRFGSNVKTFADQLRNRNLDDLLRDAQNIARRSPGTFVLGSVALGFALSRFFKATADRDAERYERSQVYRQVRPTESQAIDPREDEIARDIRSPRVNLPQGD